MLERETTPPMVSSLPVRCHQLHINGHENTSHQHPNKAVYQMARTNTKLTLTEESDVMYEIPSVLQYTGCDVGT